MPSPSPPGPPPSLFDATTLTSLASTVVLLLAALFLSRLVLDRTTPARLRALFIWHAFDALIHFVLEGSFVYHCLFSSAPAPITGNEKAYWPDPSNYLGNGRARAGAGGGAAEVMHGAQAGGGGALATLWMVYARADARWAGVDLTVLSLEMLTVVFGGLMACAVCWDIARKSPRANLGMVVLATAELYGGKSCLTLLFFFPCSGCGRGGEAVADMCVYVCQAI